MEEEIKVVNNIRKLLLNFYIEARNEFHGIPDTEMILSDLESFIEGWMHRNID